MQDPGISTPRSGDQAPAGSGSQVPAGIFLAAARELGVRAGHAVVLEDLSDQQTDDQFHAQLDASIKQIFDASVDKVPTGG